MRHRIYEKEYLANQLDAWNEALRCLIEVGPIRARFPQSVYRFYRKVFDGWPHSSRRNVVFVDVMKDNPWALALLAVKGFQFYRSLTGMYCGENAHPGRPDLLCAILGPEFG